MDNPPSSETGGGLVDSPKTDTPPQSKPNQASLDSSAVWLRPDGVTTGNWDYVRSGGIAGQYDAYLKNDPLTQADGKILHRYLPAMASNTPNPQTTRPLVCDFGCGNGRSLLPIVQRGYDGLGIDLSAPMLQTFLEKKGAIERQPRESQSGDQTQAQSQTQSTEAGNLYLCQANLVHLDGIEDHSIDVGLCLFSTLGMVHQRSNRRQFLRHVRRILKPGGKFIVHAHNVLFQIRAPGGMSWFAQSVWGHLRGNLELGDREADYRGIKNLFIHSYRRRELAADLRSAGLTPKHWHGIVQGETTVTEHVSSWDAFRMVGWIVVCD